MDIPSLRVCKLIKKPCMSQNEKLLNQLLLNFRDFAISISWSVEKGKQENTTLWVKADFEKISQNGHILQAGQQEVSEIELRLIQEIQRALEKIPPPQKSPPTKVIHPICTDS